MRSALGASRFAVVRAALSQISISMVVGLVAGVALSMAMANISFAAGPVFLLVAGVLACVAPARRVAKTDPIQVLREGG